MNSILPLCWHAYEEIALYWPMLQLQAKKMKAVLEKADVMLIYKITFILNI